MSDYNQLKEQNRILTVIATQLERIANKLEGKRSQQPQYQSCAMCGGVYEFCDCDAETYRRFRMAGR